VLTKMRTIEDELNQVFLERNEVIRGLLVGLLAREHVVLLGPPGTGKSDLLSDICGRIDQAPFFRWLMMRTTAPDELFGPVSVQALQNDSYRRNVKGKLPEAAISFLDEVFKCNSAVLNGLLGVMNERIFNNDGQTVVCPLQFMCGASNEMPESKEELGALWDRFLLRYVVGDLKSPKNFEKLMLGQNKAKSRTTITLPELTTAQAEVESVDIRSISKRITELRAKINTELNIYNSPRRWKKAGRLIQAHAWLEGRKAAEDDDLAILAACMWDEPNQIQQVRKIIMALANPLDQEAQNLLDEATEIWQNALAENDETKITKLGVEANSKLKKITKDLDAMRIKAKDTGRNTAKIDEALKSVVDMNREVVTKCLGARL